jgi:hypothetical protein
VIQAGPGKDINTYISQLNKLRQAIDYFEANHNQSQKQQNEELWNKGKQNVEREFDQLLNKFCESTLAVIEKDQDIDNNDQLVDAKTLALKESDLSQMICIIEWFKQVQPGYLDRLYEKLIQVRTNLFLDKLRRLAEKGSSGGNKVNLNSSGSSMNMMAGSTNSMNRAKSIVNSNSAVNLSHLNDKPSLRNRLT